MMTTEQTNGLAMSSRDGMTHARLRQTLTDYLKVRKAIRENRSYGATIVLLLKMDSSTQWFQELQEAGAHFLWVNKRLKFRTNKTAPFPSMLAILAGHEHNKQTRLQ